MTNLRVMVVDDEPLAREGLADLLRSMPDITVAGVFGDGMSALQAMESSMPDVLCVDIRMPGLDGFDVVAALDGERMPAVIFITAYDSFAVKAFEVNAVDYLLKPVTGDRLAVAIDKVRAHRVGTIPPQRMMNLLESLAESRRSSAAGRLIVREVGRIIVIPTNDVDWIEGADYYARLHVAGKSYLIRESLASLEKRLDTSRFLRVHRSAIVNLARVRIVEAAERGDGVAVLITGSRIKVTASRRSELEQKLTELP